jgi:hypothetical protein
MAMNEESASLANLLEQEELDFPWEEPGNPEDEELIVQVCRIREILVTRATTGGTGPATEQEYEKRRRLLVMNSDVKDFLPRFLETCYTLTDFWSLIKPMFGTYAERREYLRNEFQPVMDLLEGRGAAPGDESIFAALSRVDRPHVRRA